MRYTCRICAIHNDPGTSREALERHLGIAHELTWAEYTERHRITATWPAYSWVRHPGPWTRAALDSAMRLADNVVRNAQRGREPYPERVVVEMLRHDGNWTTMHQWGRMSCPGDPQQQVPKKTPQIGHGAKVFIEGPGGWTEVGKLTDVQLQRLRR